MREEKALPGFLSEIYYRLLVESNVCRGFQCVGCISNMANRVNKILLSFTYKHKEPYAFINMHVFFDRESHYIPTGLLQPYHNNVYTVKIPQEDTFYNLPSQKINSIFRGVRT